MNNKIKTFVQFELWKDCSNKCKFCYNKGQKDINKLESISYILTKLEEKEIQNYNEIGFIGGEFFYTELKDLNVKKGFYSIFEKLSKLNYEKIYITTALLYDIHKELVPFLNFLKSINLLDKCLICSSYDLEYRFYTKERKSLWENNMLELHKLFPTLKLHTEIILMQAFIDAVISDNFNILDFCNKYHTRIDYIEPASGFFYKNKEDCAKDIPNFFPTKSSYIAFLKKALVEQKAIDPKTFLSMDLRSSNLYYIENGKRKTDFFRRNGEGILDLSEMNKKYEIGLIDSNDKMRDLAIQMAELYDLL